MVDATQRPLLRISPEFGAYAEDKGVFELFEAMLRELLMARPESPLEFLMKLLSKPIIDGMGVIICYDWAGRTASIRDHVYVFISEKYVTKYL